MVVEFLVWTQTTIVLLAESLGIISLNLSSGVDPLSWFAEKTGGIGVDGVLITASTSSSEPVHGRSICRQRGHIVLIGVTGLSCVVIFFKKELTFRSVVLMALGVDSSYEQKGHDYPLGFVR